MLALPISAGTQAACVATFCGVARGRLRFPALRMPREIGDFFRDGAVEALAFHSDSGGIDPRVRSLRRRSCHERINKVTAHGGRRAAPSTAASRGAALASRMSQARVPLAPDSLAPPKAPG